jgi:hypothetical protein
LTSVSHRIHYTMRVAMTEVYRECVNGSTASKIVPAALAYW